MIGLKTEIKDNSDGTTSIKVFMDKAASGNWALVAEAVDSGQYGGALIKVSAPAGIRTDFMDVVFKDYQLTQI